MTGVDDTGRRAERIVGDPIDPRGAILVNINVKKTACQWSPM